MEIEIYADVLFFVNFIMDLVILFVVKKLSGKNTGTKRLISGSFIAAFLYCLLCIGKSMKTGYLLQFLILGIVLWFTFKPIDIKDFLSIFVKAVATAVFIGGSSLISYLYIMGGDPFGKSFPLSVLAVGTVLSVCLLLMSGKYFLKRLMTAQRFCYVDIFVHNKIIRLKALVDTGNSLKDPLTGKPVIIAENKAVSKILKTNIYDNPVDMGIRVLPYRTIGKEGILTGFTADKAIIEGITVEKPVVALSPCLLGTSFNGIIDPKIIGGNKFECNSQTDKQNIQ